MDAMIKTPVAENAPRIAREKPLKIKARNVDVYYGEKHAIKNLNIDIPDGAVSAFIVDIPSGFTDAASVLPIQIYLWSDLPEVAFQSKTAGAIIVLLMFLFVMNAAAIMLRKRFERRW